MPLLAASASPAQQVSLEPCFLNPRDAATRRDKHHSATHLVLPIQPSSEEHIRPPTARVPLVSRAARTSHSWIRRDFHSTNASSIRLTTRTWPYPGNRHRTTTINGPALVCVQRIPCPLSLTSWTRPSLGGGRRRHGPDVLAGWSATGLPAGPLEARAVNSAPPLTLTPQQQAPWSRDPNRGTVPALQVADAISCSFCRGSRP